MNKPIHKNPLSLCISATSLLLGLGVMPGLAMAQAESDGMIEEVLVSGSYRGSLASALEQKRNAPNAKETIMAEDIGKMPDLNLAESIQRLPGVTIEGGR